jgi:putative ABC transport system permease protein
MFDLVKIALRNLLRYRRRTLLTASLISIGVVFVLVFISVSASFKHMMVGQITDSFLGHIQIHKKGYVASIDNLPLTLGLSPKAFAKVEKALNEMPEIEAYSKRIKFGGMFSNFMETTNIRLNGVYPEDEIKTSPLLLSRITQGEKSLQRGDIILPELLAKGMKVKVDDTVVVIATNRDGSVNGKQFHVSGILESATGPGGRDGYIHFEDAQEVLRMEAIEISEVAIRLKDFTTLHSVFARLEASLGTELNTQGKPAFELHTWEKLSPFYNIAKMIDLMTFFVKLMLMAIVLISIMNVMVMAVYERIREIGTIAAIGTLPGKIMAMFLVEGLSLGVFGAVVGNVVGVVLIFLLDMAHLTFDFGRQEGLSLSLNMPLRNVLLISTIVIAISALASLHPAYKASRMNAIDALRHV